MMWHWEGAIILALLDWCMNVGYSKHLKIKHKLIDILLKW